MEDPHFAQPKLKDNWVHFPSDFGNLNKKLKCKPYPKPNINEILLKLYGYNHATSLDLNMVYYHIKLIENTSSVCTIILSCVMRVSLRESRPRNSPYG